MIKLVLITLTLIGLAFATGSSAPTVDILKYGTYDHCEGKYAANYTIILKITLDQYCTKNDDDLDTVDQLIACGGNNQRSVNNLQPLSKASFPAGAYTQTEKLWVSTSGSLEGKYVYEKTIYLDSAYLKKCSSVLGYTYVTSKSTAIYIADKLDINALVSPTGAFETFRQSATTACQGVAYCF